MSTPHAEQPRKLIGATKKTGFECPGSHRFYLPDMKTCAGCNREVAGSRANAYEVPTTHYVKEA